MSFNAWKKPCLLENENKTIFNLSNNFHRVFSIVFSIYILDENLKFKKKETFFYSKVYFLSLVLIVKWCNFLKVRITLFKVLWEIFLKKSCWAWRINNLIASAMIAHHFLPIFKLNVRVIRIYSLLDSNKLISDCFLTLLEIFLFYIKLLCSSCFKFTYL